MYTFLITFLIMGLIVVAAIFLVVRRGLQFKELCEHGVDAQAVVTEKRSVSGQGSGSAQKKVVYRYSDNSGASHSHTSVVTDSVFYSCEEGSPFPIVYSGKNPSVSAPKYLVDQARGAVA